MCHISAPSVEEALTIVQVNVTYDDRTLQGIDRIASAKGLSRPDLLRAIASEVIEAHDAGRLVFQMDDAPRIDASLNALAIQFREAVIEMERTQRANQRHEKKLLHAFVSSEEAVRAAQEILTARINDINRKSYEPFVAKMAEVRTAMTELRSGIMDAQDEKLAAMEGRIDAVRAAFPLLPRANPAIGNFYAIGR